MNKINIDSKQGKFQPILKYGSLLTIAVGLIVGQNQILSVVQDLGCSDTGFILVLFVVLSFALCNTVTSTVFEEVTMRLDEFDTFTVSLAKKV